jgi:DNA-binding GntR family transcriptional regulator
MRKFWMVWNINNRSPVYQHYSLDDATREAARLARVNPDSIFVVLEAVSACKTKSPLEWITLPESDDIPF